MPKPRKQYSPQFKLKAVLEILKGEKTIALPLACVSYFPAASFLQQDNISWKTGLYTPLFGFVFLFLALSVGKRTFIIIVP